MSIRITCRSCGARLSALEKHAGRQIKCPSCGKRVQVPKAEEEVPEDELEEEEAKPRSRRVVVIREPAQDAAQGTDVAGALGVVAGFLALVCLVMGYFTSGITYWAAAPLALVGFVLGFLGRGTLRITDLALNFLVLLPACIVLTLHIVGLPVTNSPRQSLPLGLGLPEPAMPKPIELPAGTEEIVPASPKPNWLDARKDIARQGHVAVRINDVRVDVPKNDDMALLNEILKQETSKKTSLLISVQVGNASKDLKVELRRWSKSGYRGLVLTDDKGNQYKPENADLLALSALGGDRGLESIYPNANLTDVLVYEIPVKGMRMLKLEIPAENFGGKGKLYFQIPANMIQLQ